MTGGRECARGLPVTFTPHPREQEEYPVATAKNVNAPDGEELFSKDEIWSVDDNLYDLVDVPEWGNKKVRIKSLSGSERDRYEQSLGKIDKKGNMVPDLTNQRARLVALCVVDGKGNRMFSDTEVLKLGTKNAKPLGRIYEAAAKLSGLGEQAAEEAEADFEEAQS
jgi:hypothetical protein